MVIVILLSLRYEILMVSMSPPPGEEERSAAYYVIKVGVKLINDQKLKHQTIGNLL